MSRSSWNRGLTKETDPRVKGWNKGLTKDTDTRVALMAERRRGGSSWSHGLTKETDQRVALGAVHKRGKTPWNRGRSTLDVGYRTVHMRARNRKTGVCAHCGERKKTTMALIHGRATRCQLNDPKRRHFSVNLDDYVELCYRCHWHYDREDAR